MLKRFGYLREILENALGYPFWTWVSHWTKFINWVHKNI